MSKVSPLPLCVIQTSHDKDTSAEGAKRLFDLAHEPKRFVLVQAEDHRFDGNQGEFFQQLYSGLLWIDDMLRLP